MNKPRLRPLRPLLATALLVFGAAALQAADAAPRGGPDGMGAGPPMMMMMMPGGPRLDRMLDAANASPEQRTQVKAILDAARADLRALREAGRPLQEQAAALFTQPTVDARAAEVLRQQMVAQHDKASQRQMQAMLDVSRVLGADQRKAMADRMAEQRAAMERRHGERSRPAN